MTLKGKGCLVVFGTRPEAIKLAPVIHALAETAGTGTCVSVCNTGQHREVLDDVLSAFGVVPDDSLAVMKPGQSLADLTVDLMTGIDRVIRRRRPACVVVQGDTASAYSAALAGFYNRLPVAHVEAGLRTNNRYSPFPEEIYRQCIGRMATYHFAPTDAAVDALEREGITEQVYKVGNTGIDALLYMLRRLGRGDLSDRLVPLSDGHKIVLVTGHRRENLGAGLENICRALKRLVTESSDVQVVYAMHPNPEVQQCAKDILGGLERVTLLDPVGYPDFVGLMSRAYVILTDSGGIQEEAPSLGVPILVTRDTTERREGVQGGGSLVVGSREAAVYDALATLIADPVRHRQMSAAHQANPYGDGHAARRIAERLRESGFC